jgi:uncharacterized protein (UPF0303 family)
MIKTDYYTAEEIIKKQEEMLQFEHFSNQIAWELGQLMVGETHKTGIELAVSIRKLNGNIIFQYASENTNLNNQHWMNRKFNTVKLMERSSLGVAVLSKITLEDVQTHGLSDRDYVFCGGGFPVRIKGGGIVGIVIVSNMPHVQDHEFIVKCLSEYLKVTGVPVVDMEI